MNEKVKQVLASIVDTFKSGKIPEAVALASFPVPDIPSTNWSFMNRTIMFLSGTIDARGFRQWKEADRWVKKGAKVIYLERVLEGGGEPLVLDRKFILPHRSQPLLESELGHGSMEDLFEGNPEMVPVRSELKLSATILTKREAQVLTASKGDAAFCMEQHIFAANDRRIIWGWLIYRGDRFNFESSSRLL